MRHSRSRTPTAHGTFGAAIADSEARTQAIARAVRQLIIQMMPNVVEVPWPKQHNVGYGTGVKKKSEHFCHITAYARHVNLGFDYGTELGIRAVSSKAPASGIGT